MAVIDIGAAGDGGLKRYSALHPPVVGTQQPDALGTRGHQAAVVDRGEGVEASPVLRDGLEVAVGRASHDVAVVVDGKDMGPAAHETVESVARRDGRVGAGERAGHEARRGRMEEDETVVGGQVEPVGVGQHAAYDVVRHVGRRRRAFGAVVIVVEEHAVEAAQPVGRAQPDEAVRGLDDAEDGVVGQSLHGGERAEVGLRPRRHDDQQEQGQPDGCMVIHAR